MNVVIVLLLVGILAACTFLRDEHLANAPVRKVKLFPSEVGLDYEENIIAKLKGMTSSIVFNYGIHSYDLTVPWTYLSSLHDYRITIDFDSASNGIYCTISAFPAEGGITSAKIMGDCNRLIEDVMLCINSCCKDE